MNWSEWKKQFNIIKKSLKLTFEQDHDAGQVLNEGLIEIEVIDTLEKIKDLIVDKICYVFGCGPSLEENIVKIKNKIKDQTIIIAADGATTALLDHGIIPHIIVSDLDGDMEKIVNANKKGSYLVIHAHGDNIPSVKKHTLNFINKIGTVQIEPFGKLKNFGGFTDGDRAVFLAEHYKAKKIYLFGFDFGNMVGKYSKMGHDNNYPASNIKKKKLEIAESLINHIKEHTDILISNCTNNV